jgi:hypothetical protein
MPTQDPWVDSTLKLVPPGPAEAGIVKAAITAMAASAAMNRRLVTFMINPPHASGESSD